MAVEDPERDARWLRYGIVAFAGLLLIAIVASVELSTVRLAYGTLLSGPKVLWRGHSTSFRVALMEPRSLHFLEGFSGELLLRDEHGERLRVPFAGGELAEVQLVVPEDLGTFAFIDVAVQHASGPDRQTLAVQAVDHPAPAALRWLSNRDLQPRDAVGASPSAAYRLELFADSGWVVGGLPNPMWVQVWEGDTPAADVLVNGTMLPEPARTDAAGLVRLTYTPSLPLVPLRLRIGEAPAITAELSIAPKPTGIWLDVQPRGVVPHGSTLRITAHTLPFRHPMQVDVWAEGTPMLATSELPTGGRATVEVALPEGLTGLVRVEAYRNVAAPDDSAVTVYRLVGTPQEALAAAANLHIEGEPPALWREASAKGDVEMLAVALTRLAPREAGLPLVYNSTAARLAALTAERDALRGHAHALFLAVGVLGVAFTLIAVLGHQFRVRRAVQTQANEAIDANEEIDPADWHRIAEIRHTVVLWTSLLAVGFALYATYFLLTHLYWGL